MKEPLVSVIMPVYNEKKSILLKSIDSILEQSYRNLQLIIILDNPKNGEAEKIIRNVKDKRIIFKKNRKNLGRAASRNKAIRISQGIYIAIQDADDISLPNRIREQVGYFEKQPDTDILFSSIQLINEEGHKIGNIIRKKEDVKRLQRNIFTKNVLFHPTMMVKAEILKRELYNIHFIRAQDYELWLRCLGKYRFDILEEVLVKYRIPNRRDITERIRRQREYSSYTINALLKHPFLNAYYLFDLAKQIILLLITFLPKKILSKIIKMKDGRK